MKNLALKAVNAFDRLCQRMPVIGPLQPPRGWFSAYEHLTNGQLTGRELYPSQESGPEPEGSVTRISELNQARFQPWPAFWIQTDDALLLGRNALWRNENREFCLEAAYHLKERRRLSEDHVLARTWAGGAEHLHGAWTSIASNWGDGKNYFHWIFDNLTRLMVRERLPEETRILIPANAPRYAMETLELLGLWHLASPINGRPLRPERFYFCSPTAMTGVWNPAGCDWLRRSFSEYRSKRSDGRPVFFTRRAATRVPGEIQRIETTFRNNGFQIVDCAKLTVAEQIASASNAPAIAGIHGAAMSNLLWANPGVPVLEIFSPGYLNGCYEQIAFQGQLKYSYTIITPQDFTSQITLWLNNNSFFQ